MDERTRQLQDQLSKLVKEGRSIIEKAEAEKRDLNQEEDNRYDAIFGDIASVKTGSTANQIAAEEPGCAKPCRPSRRPRRGRPTQPGRQAGASVGAPDVPARARLDAQPRHRARRRAARRPVRGAFNRYLRGGLNSLTETERRDLQMDADTQGGFLVPPQEFSAALIQAVDDAVWIRQFATVETVTQAESLGIASLDADPADADWTAEVEPSAAPTPR
jgi:HK97 family phage major capsid protein